MRAAPGCREERERERERERLGHRRPRRFASDVGVLQRTVDDTDSGRVQPFACLAFHLRFARWFPRGGNANGEFFHAGKRARKGGKREREGERERGIQRQRD